MKKAARSDTNQEKLGRVASLSLMRWYGGMGNKLEIQLLSDAIDKIDLHLPTSNR